MPGSRRIRALALGAALLLGGCSAVSQVVGDPGAQQTETRTVSAVSSVELATSGQLTLTTGDPPALRITAGKNVLGHLTSDVRGDRLVLDADGSVHNFGRVRYELVLPAARTVELSGSGTVQVSSPSALQAVTLSGSGDVRVDGLATEQLTVDLSGSGRITVSGTTTRQRVSLGGSGHYAAGGLASQDAEVTIGGSGSADVQVSGTLTAVVTGSGSITYTGDAAVSSRVTGSGSVVHR